MSRTQKRSCAAGSEAWTRPTSNHASGNWPQPSRATPSSIAGANGHTIESAALREPIGRSAPGAWQPTTSNQQLGKDRLVDHPRRIRSHRHEEDVVRAYLVVLDAIDRLRQRRG